MTAHHKLLAAVPWVAALLWAAPAHATVMIEVPLEEMIATADAVVVAQVLRSESRLVVTAERGAEPHTFTELAVSEWLSGAGTERLVIDEIGGTVGDETYLITGTPTYAPGGEVIVFLERRPDGSLRTLAMSQGRFEIRRGIGGVPDAVHRNLEGIAFATWANGQMSVGHTHGAEPAVELEVFLTTLRGLAAAGASLTMPTRSSGGVR